MLNPAIGKLIREYDSRYQLVHDVADEARRISEEAESNHEILVEKPVSLAIDKIAAELDEKKED